MAKQKTNWPDQAELKAMDKKMIKAKGSAGIPANADPLDRAKYSLCAEFVKYCLTHDISQRDVAAKLDVSESRISEIVRYRIDKLTVDRLIKYLGKLNPKFKLNVAS
ncbi:MAG: XRE family transcriptional regulator [Bdellovibrionota bacterium]